MNKELAKQASLKRLRTSRDLYLEAGNFVAAKKYQDMIRKVESGLVTPISLDNPVCQAFIDLDNDK